jgi:phenylacetic acid degradation operon negative regulatory protein
MHAAAVRARTEVMEIYRRFSVIDPLLPTTLLPRDWPRGRAREVFIAVYDGLAEPAQRHVRTVVERVADGVDIVVQAHTIGQKDAGPAR